MKTIDIGYSGSEFFMKLGFDVTLSNVECCGMAGSFGYKKDYYDLSKRVGSDLIDQIEAADSDNNKKNDDEDSPFRLKAEEPKHL